MGGVVGKLFREFAVTLSVALAISMFVSLTLTPMLCSRLFRKDAPKPHRMPNGRRWPQTVVLDWISSGLRKLHTAYVASLGTVMKHKLLTMVILLLTIVGNVSSTLRSTRGYSRIRIPAFSSVWFGLISRQALRRWIRRFCV